LEEYELPNPPIGRQSSKIVVLKPLFNPFISFPRSKGAFHRKSSKALFKSFLTLEALMLDFLWIGSLAHA